MTHLPCVAIIVAVCAVVLCVALSLGLPMIRRLLTGCDCGQWYPCLKLRRPTRTIPNEQAKRRAMWAKIVRKM